MDPMERAELSPAMQAIAIWHAMDGTHRTCPKVVWNAGAKPTCKDTGADIGDMDGKCHKIVGNNLIDQSKQQNNNH